MWTLLLLTLPTQPNAVRLRVWRALKALGCATPRDGAYLLPHAEAHRFEPLVAEVRAHGGQAQVLDAAPRSDEQRDTLLALFDRAAAYVAWRTEVAAFEAALPAIDEPEARRRWRAATEALAGLRRIDYYPGAAAEQAEATLATLARAVAARFAPDEPQPRGAGAIERLERHGFQGRRWATRARPWVDRLACAWLIRRFIDPEARFVWLRDTARAPRGVLGFDYDGARFTHVGARVSFEVLAESFGLLDGADSTSSGLHRVAQIVHVLDVGGIPVPEAAGLEAVLAGLRSLHTDDDALAAAAATVFDALYAAPAASP